MHSTCLKYLICFSIALFFSAGCGQSADQKITSNLISAEIHLSKRECQASINLLEGMGRQTSNARYLKLLSSSYACRAGYSTTVFFGSDVALTATPAPLGGATKYSTSLSTFTSPLIDDQKFSDLQTAIDLLLYAGGLSSSTEPTSIARATVFDSNDAAEINSQLAFMMFVEFGRFMKVYSNASAAGVKGAGGASNVCFADYPNIADPDVITILNNMPGACKVTNSGHTQLASTLSASVRRERLCQGIILLNGILDLLPSILVSAGGGSLTAIASVTTNVQAAKTALTTAFPAIGTVLSVLNQNTCETDPAITIETIESYYATIFEALIQ